MSERLQHPPHWEQVLETALNLPGRAGETYSRFRTLSLGNQALLLMQGVIEPVHTFKGWPDLNRHVKKGSKAKSIYVPMFRRQENESGDEERRLSGFKLVNCMFAVSDTEGDDLPEYEAPTWSKERALGSLAISEIAYESINGNAQGYSHGREFAVNPVAVYPFKTMQHELSHIVHGHTTEERLQEYRVHRGLYEFEAEGSAYLIMNELGATDQFDADESRHYIQSWLRDQQPDEKSIRSVFSTADKIIKVGRPTETKEGDEA
ncbi:ArdC-like ssDNA-binding domain-containing protein [Arthrobacter sp. AL12]|uniref:ArdC-like ssDNA-binding domain-containing protein n=1 Tax=Arthrobacter sp. AL12 TaxID=3042241 RepID=UPI00249AB61D|nr:ArdC-like ssDNA-binding domain-containing protein [Arthrobacter sp. AL12]MDI3211794.1 ArdC-like ssDNA-binding domain-containing protein [Arthrobacter sp. AL12]